MLTEKLTLTDNRQFQLFAKLAHPAYMPGRNPNHQCIGRHILVDYCSCAYEGKLANGDTADDGAVGAERGTLLHQGVSIFALALDQRTRVVDVGENHTRTAEDACLERDVVIHRDVVLNLAVIADQHLVADEYVLPQGYTFADPGAGAYVDEMPDARTFADLCAFIDDSAGMLVVAHRLNPAGEQGTDDLHRSERE